MATRTLSKLVAVALDNSLLLVAGTVAALTWANADVTSYDAVAHPLHFWVNDVGMVFFFAIAAKEIFEATLPGGSLSSVRQAAVPLIAATGGMVVPGALYAVLVVWSGRLEFLRGWAIPCATDIAFSYLVARLIFGRTHPALPFLLLLAIADDALGLVILAAFYPSAELNPMAFALLLGIAMTVAWMLQRRGVNRLWPYMALCGSLAWAGFYIGGFHPALALVPIVPFIPHARRDTGLFDEREAHKTDPLNRLEHVLRVPVQVILLLFGFANAGVPFSGIGPGTWIVLTAITVGKPIGITASVALASLVGFRQPSGIGWSELAVVGFVAGIGFTVALFFATAAFPAGELLDQTKMGAVFSFAAAGLALITARLLRVNSRPTV